MDPLTLDRGVKLKSERMLGKRIALAVSGGIGAVEVVRIAREIRRHGASVSAFFTPSVVRFITPLSVEWATERPVVLEVGADVKHFESFDLVVVAPATLNTISKGALALADNPVTLLIATQLGKRAPLLFVPAMNVQLKDHPAYRGYQQTLQSWGATFFESPLEEDRLKMPQPESLVEAMLKVLSC